MWEYEHVVEGAVSTASVWAIWTDIAGWPEWNPGIRTITTDGPLAAGTTFTMITPPDDDAITLTIVGVEPGRSFTDRFDGGDVLVTTVHRVEDRGEGCRVTYRTEITGPAADEVGPEMGPAITEDFPDVVAALLQRATYAGG